ncbi:MAG: AbrB/MazE/SpoVT family DNA-binding domain-containing protein [Nitrolancea sp.]
MMSTVSERGQITIDRDVRKRLGIEPGMIAYQRVVDGRLEVVFLPAPHSRSLAGALADVGERVPPVSDDELDGMVRDAIAAELKRTESEHE